MKLKVQNLLISTGELKPSVLLKKGDLLLSESAPSGSTTGSYEKDLRSENDKDFEAVLNNCFCLSQKDFDKQIKCFGSDLSVPASLLHWKYYYGEHFVPKRVPKVILNLVNGGKHTGGSSVMAEFMIIPNGKTIRESIDIAVKVWDELGRLLKGLGQNTYVSGREGGYVTKGLSDEDIIGTINEAIENSGVDCSIAIDVAGNNFCEKRKGGFFYLGKSTSRQLKYYEDLLKAYPRITYLEDAFCEDDFDGWKALMKNKKVLVVADDLTVTNKKRIKKCKDCFNGIILKPNQIGTVSELTEAFDESKGAVRIMSQRSGETDSATIVDLGLSLGVDMFKLGACTRERMIKYNRLLVLEAMQW